MSAKRKKVATPNSSKDRTDSGRSKNSDVVLSQEGLEGLYWVGIGASAGGLEALRELVSNIPPGGTKDVTYIVAQHLSPKHQSMLVQLVARETSIAVKELQNGTLPEANVMYITPPNSDVFVEEDRLYLREPIAPHTPKPSVDYFFTTLAEQLKSRAIGVVLSGTGSDGAHGMRAIRAAGGVTIVQEPKSAKYDGMPVSAIEIGGADIVLSPDEIIKTIFNIIQHPRDIEAFHSEAIERTSIEELLHRLKERSGVDFKDYKTGTLFRRLNRRIAACSAKNLDEYLVYISKVPDELDELFNDITITVTEFFRDEMAFESLKQRAKKMLSEKSEGDNLRLWVPGCATGEEAYSLAMIFAEVAGSLPELLQKFNFQIFATDIDANSLLIARKGLYPETSLLNVPDNVKGKYFRQRESSYEIVGSVRDVVVFSKHNVFQDPPFLRIDMISCRNLLIYFTARLQHKVLNLFHYALQPDGLLFLGKSETPGNSTSLFRTVDNKNKLYKPKVVTANVSDGFKVSYSASHDTVSKMNRPGSGRLYDLPDAVIEALAPVSLLIDENMDVVRIYGDVQSYTQLSPGSASMNLMSISRKGFRQELRALVYKVSRTDTVHSLVIKGDKNVEQGQQVSVKVFPLNIKNSTEKLLLISFERVISPPSKKKVIDKNNEKELSFVTELEQELSATKENLQTVIEELETSNEELQSTNEDMQSTNEELQSSNEELETSNEELQSANEELLTVNDELQVRSGELAATNEDLNNIKESVDFPLIVVDKLLKVKRYNNAAKDIFHLIGDSEGNSITNIATLIDIPELRKNILNVIKTGEVFTRQLENDGMFYFESVLPYKDSNGKIHGSVLTYLNNTAEQQALQHLKQSEERFDLAVQGSSSGVWGWNITTDEMYWSPILLKLLGLKKGTDGYSFQNLKKRIHPDDICDFDKSLKRHLEERSEYSVECRIQKNDGSYFWGHVSGRAVWDEHNLPQKMGGSIHDITMQKDALEQLTDSNESLERFASICSHDLKEPTRVVKNYVDLIEIEYGEELDAKLGRYFHHIKHSALRMQEMIQNILSYSQLENKSVVFTLVDCEMELKKVLDNLELSISETGAEVTFEKLPKVYGDRMQLFQVFQNLIGNAIKFCIATPKVHIAADVDGESWDFSVSDNGIGMKKRHLDKIFDVFEQLNVTEAYPGTGIGLSICQKIIQKHGGKIWVESKLNKGSTFYFSLPKRDNV